MDVLSDVLDTVRLKDMKLGRASLSAPWGFRVADPEPRAALYRISGGGAWLEAEGLDAPLRLEDGDLVLLPRGQRHALRDDPASATTLLRPSELPSAAPETHEGAAALLSASFQLEGRVPTPLLTLLPPVIHVSAGRSSIAASLAATLSLLAEQSATERPAGGTVQRRLAELLLVEAIRTHLEVLVHEPVASGWLQALVDPQIGAALGHVHESPETEWTVASLAKTVHMSRSAFAARFTQLVGESPLQYVTRWRMQKAASLLRVGRQTLAEIAGLVGYDSEAAFSKAYKRWVGASPGAYRRAAQASARAARPRVPATLGTMATAGLALD
jgi:AraC-like DNA-binding protein